MVYLIFSFNWISCILSDNPMPYLSSPWSQDLTLSKSFLSLSISLPIGWAMKLTIFSLQDGWSGRTLMSAEPELCGREQGGPCTINVRSDYLLTANWPWPVGASWALRHHARCIQRHFSLVLEEPRLGDFLPNLRIATQKLWHFTLGTKDGWEVGDRICCVTEFVP